MRPSLHFIFLTFVLVSESGLAAPDTALPKKRPSVSSENEFDEDPGPVKKEPTQITYPDNIVPGDTPPPFRYHRLTRKPRDFNIMAGFSNGDILEENDRLSTQFISLRYIPHENFRHAWDFTATAHLKTLVDYSVGHRWYSDSDDSYGSYYRVAAVNYVDAKDGLSGLLNMRHIKIVGAKGLSDLFEMDRRFCAEVGAGYGLSGLVIYLQAGYNFNF